MAEMLHELETRVAEKINAVDAEVQQLGHRVHATLHWSPRAAVQAKLSFTILS
ncbi:Hypothetical predicted protein [Pelobates cultripes]|uniref:Uncharacterized protein n=1 Tax=Pelobates cultripes TaxID=61616 RepID=A0AAD1W841_PELCU|nr:Hypothetical predicted protein [Pelobates cultripes]